MKRCATGGSTGRRGAATMPPTASASPPRRARSPWSKRNVGIVGRLERGGRMHPAGVAEVERAKADGRWDAAYAGQASMEVPADLAAALAAQPRAQAMFDILTSQNRYAVLYRIASAKRADTRTRRIENFVACSPAARRSTRRSASSPTDRQAPGSRAAA